MLRFRYSIFAIIFIVSCFLPTAALAQDAHYWDNQYGTKGSLLGGVVVGSPSDLSASFYNPAWIARSEDPSFLISTKAWEASSITSNGKIESGLSPDSSHIGTSPGFMAWQVRSRVLDGWVFVVSSLSRIRFEYNSGITQVSEGGVPGIGNDDWFIREAYHFARTSEDWFGLTMARKFSDHISGGITVYGVYRSQRSRIEVFSSSLADAGGYANGRALDEYTFWHTRLLAKIGFAYDGDPVSFGVTFTTPSLGVLGDGSVYQHLGYSYTSDIGGAPTESALTADMQTDLSADWKSPMAVALGASWKKGRTRFHISTEWFNSISDQVIMAPDSYYSQSTGDEFEYQSFYSYRSIINFGLGVDHRVGENTSLYGSFRSDYSAIDDDLLGNYILADWNIWHVSTGASFEVMGIEMTTGLQYSFGEGTDNRYLNMGISDESEFLANYTSDRVDYRHLKLMVGFDLTFDTP